MTGIVEIQIVKDSNALQVFTLTHEGRYTLGRGQGCDLRVDEPNLSREHLIFSLSQGILSLTDCSRYGSAICGQPILQNIPRPVNQNILIELAGCDLKVYIDVEKYYKMTGERRENISQQRQPDSSCDLDEFQNIIPRLMQSGELVFGRSQRSDICLPSMQVSRCHAVMRHEAGKITLEDLGTTNGTFLNGQPINGKVWINATDQITIGTDTFIPDKGRVQFRYAIIAKDIEKVYPNGFVGLNKMNIEVLKNEFVALMGPSGCGKSTLLKCLNGANPVSAGEINILGVPLSNANFNSLKKHIGYVPQDDIVHGELSVEKTLFYAAKLRMNMDVSNEEIDQKINQVLVSLNLDVNTVRKTFVCELSGGQRKRISIAVELLNDPAILFLDEPTSPLDPETIGDFLSCIQGLVKGGQTVIMVTHKPSDLDYVDKLIFLSKGGYQTYYGDKNQVLKYFKVNNIIEIYSMMKNIEDGKFWNKAWSDLNPYTESISLPQLNQSNSSPSGLRQLLWLSRRYFNIKCNDTRNLVLLVAQPAIIAILLIFIFDQLQLSVLFMMATSAVWFGVSNASKEIVSELNIYERERMFNLNIGNYIFSKLAVLSIFALAQTMIFVSIIYFSYLIRDADVQLWLYWPNVGFLFYLSISATLFGLLLSALFDTAEKVMTIVPIALMPQIMLAGIIARMDSKLEILLSYLTLGRWGTEGLAHIQDESARALNKWANTDNSVPASVVQIIASNDLGGTMSTGTQILASSAIGQLGFIEGGGHLVSFFPDNLSMVMAAIAFLSGLFFVGIYMALKSKDSRFI